MLRGLRFFAFGDNVINIRNFAARGGSPGVVTGGATADAILGGGWRALNGDQTDNLVTFGNGQDYFGNDSRDITVICRARANSSHIGCVVDGKNGSASTGWFVLYSNSGSSEQGFNFAVFSAAGKFMETKCSDDTTLNQQDVVFAGVYQHALHDIATFMRFQGQSVATLQQATHTNTNSSNTATEDWDVRTGAAPWYWFGIGAATFFNGDLAWVAVFDRALTNDEIAQWSQDECWPFVEDYPINTAFTAHLYETVIRVDQSAGYTQAGGGRTEVNAIDVSSFLSGDFTSSGGSTGVHTYVTSISVGVSETVGQPLLRKYNTTIGVDANSLATGFTMFFDTIIGVGQDKELLIDDRLDLMNTIGYRR